MAQVNKFYNTTASGVISAGECVLSGMYVNSTSSGTVKLYNSKTATTVADVINNTITPAIGYHVLGNVHCTAGVYAVIGGTALDVTFHIKETN